jgi:FKBP-type peptidyl-prolyl cis-trans isomerase
MKFWSNLFFGLMLSGCIMSCNDPENPNEQIEKEIAAIDDYLKANNTDYIAYDASGMRVVIKEFGNDAPPKTGQIVDVTYTARVFPDGAVFDSGVINKKIDDIGTPLGLQRGIASILNGTHAVLYIPSKYAFGEAGVTGVPANSTVVYDIVLNEVTRTSTEQAKFEADTAAIHNYLVEKNLFDNAVMHESGVWYTISSGGTGPKPKPYDIISFEYDGKLMSNGSSFDKGTFQQGIFALIDGLKIGIPLMNEGGSATFYIPSGYGYGAKGTTGIAADANIIFDIKLNDIVN